MKVVALWMLFGILGHSMALRYACPSQSWCVPSANCQDGSVIYHFKISSSSKPVEYLCGVVATEGYVCCLEDGVHNLTSTYVPSLRNWHYRDDNKTGIRGLLVSPWPGYETAELQATGRRLPAICPSFSICVPPAVCPAVAIRYTSNLGIITEKFLCGNTYDTKAWSCCSIHPFINAIYTVLQIDNSVSPRASDNINFGREVVKYRQTYPALSIYRRTPNVPILDTNDVTLETRQRRSVSAVEVRANIGSAFENLISLGNDTAIKINAAATFQGPASKSNISGRSGDGAGIPIQPGVQFFHQWPQTLVKPLDESANCGTPKTPAGQAPSQTYNANIASSGVTIEGQYPWHAAILTTKNEYLCGATIVSERHVITVAHCVDKVTATGIRVRVGDYDLTTNTETLPSFDVEVNNIVYHPDYTRETLKADLAILSLKHPVLGIPNVARVCLPGEGQTNKHECYVPGWGSVTPAKDGSARFTNFHPILKHSGVLPVNRDICQKQFRDEMSLGTFFKLLPGISCVKGILQADACHGDGGSGVVCRSNSGEFILEGLISWSAGCDRGLPTAIVDAAFYTEYILNVIKSQTFQASGTLNQAASGQFSSFQQASDHLKQTTSSSTSQQPLSFSNSQRPIAFGTAQGVSAVNAQSNFSSQQNIYNVHQSGYGSQQSSYGSQQSGYGSQQSGYGSQQSGYGSQQSGYGSQQSGYGSQQSGYGSQQSGYGSQQSGYGSQQSGYGSQHTGYGTQQTGYGTQQTGYGTQQTGYGSQQTGYGSQQTGYGSQQSGYGSQQSGYGSQQSGYGSQHTDYGSQLYEYGSQQSGYGSQQSGYGSQQPGYGSQQPGYGSQQPGYGSQQSGYGLHEAGDKYEDESYNAHGTSGAYPIGGPDYSSNTGYYDSGYGDDKYRPEYEGSYRPPYDLKGRPNFGYGQEKYDPYGNNMYDEYHSVYSDKHKYNLYNDKHKYNLYNSGYEYQQSLGEYGDHKKDLPGPYNQPEYGHLDKYDQMHKGYNKYKQESYNSGSKHDKYDVMYKYESKGEYGNKHKPNVYNTDTYDDSGYHVEEYDDHSYEKNKYGSHKKEHYKPDNYASNYDQYYTGHDLRKDYYDSFGGGYDGYRQEDHDTGRYGEDYYHTFEEYLDKYDNDGYGYESKDENKYHKYNKYNKPYSKDYKKGNSYSKAEYGHDKKDKHSKPHYDDYKKDDSYSKTEYGTHDKGSYKNKPYNIYAKDDSYSSQDHYSKGSHQYSKGSHQYSKGSHGHKSEYYNEYKGNDQHYNIKQSYQQTSGSYSSHQGYDSTSHYQKESSNSYASNVGPNYANKEEHYARKSDAGSQEKHAAGASENGQATDGGETAEISGQGIVGYLKKKYTNGTQEA